MALLTLVLLLTGFLCAAVGLLDRYLHRQIENVDNSEAERDSDSLHLPSSMNARPVKLAENSPVSVNYHFTRKCNYSCTFCFHTDTTSYQAPLNDAKRALRLLRDAGMRKLNFAGGEPFLYPTFMGLLVDFCKEELRLDTVSIVSNGSKIKKAWLQKHAKNLDILAISCDSFNEATNIEIGRGKGEHVSTVFEVADWCHELDIMFKLNTVVCAHNWQEDMNEQINRLAPFRWKVFQVLLVKGENHSDMTKRDVRPVLISDEQYAAFCKRHKNLNGERMVEEANTVMAKSYLILDEQLRFLDRDGKGASGSVLEVGVETALGQVTWDHQGFEARGGMFFEHLTEQREGKTGCGQASAKKLEF